VRRESRVWADPVRAPGQSWTCWAAPAAIVAVAAFLRLYALGVPELLHDEALVAGAALHDLGYIFRRALHSDAHPPYFYYLAKLYMQAGMSETSLRLVSALAGTGAVLALYRLGRRAADRATGLFASALLAVHLLHLELSRVLRPHSLTILLAVLAAGYFLDMVERRDRRGLAMLLLTNLALSFLHFNTLLILGAQMAAAGFLLAAGRLPFRYGLKFLAGCAAILPVNLWFAALRLGDFPGVDTKASMAWTAARSLSNFDSLLTLAPLPLANAAGWLLCALGLAAFFRLDREKGLILAAFTLLPPLALIAARYGIIYEPWHLAFLLPFLLLFCGKALSLTRIPASWCAPALALFLGFVLWTGKQADLYGPNANMFNHGLGQRSAARALPPMMPPSTAVAFVDRSFSDFTNWYLRQYSTKDLTRLHLDDEPEAGITLVSPPPLPLQAHGGRLAKALGEPSLTAAAGPLTLSHWRVKRDPVVAVDKLPARIELPADMEKVLARAAKAKDIAPVLSPIRDALAPSRYDSPGTLTYRLENRSGAKAHGLVMRTGFGNVHPGNRFTVSIRLDGGPEETVFAQSAATPAATVKSILKAPEGFNTLDITVSMLCSSGAPSMNNIPDTLAYNGMDLVLESGEGPFVHGVALVEAGLNAHEEDARGVYRWGLGPESQLFFVPDKPGRYILDMAGWSPLPGQKIDVLLDGAPVASLELPEADRPASATARFTAEAGNRLLTLRYSRFNHGPGGAFAPDDGRHLAAAFTRLSLRPAQPTPSRLVFVEQ